MEEDKNIQGGPNKMLQAVFSETNEDIDFIFPVIKWYRHGNLLMRNHFCLRLLIL